MAHRNLTLGSLFVPEVPLLRHRRSAAILVAGAASPVLVIAWLVEPALILPVLCLVSFLNAAVIGLYAWFAGVPGGSDRVTSWDAAGACLFVAFATGMLSEVEHVAMLSGFLAGVP